MPHRPALPQNITVLLVDGDAQASAWLRPLLQQSGYCHADCGPACLTQASSVEEAIAAAAHTRPDVVLAHLGLSDTGAPAMVQRLTSAIGGVPLIAMDHIDDDAAAVAALEAGAQDYLVKGQFDARALGRALRNALVRERLESRLRMFEVALDSAANGIVITDVQGRIEWVNSAFVQMTGYTRAQALGHNPGELVRSGVHDADFYRRMWDTILRGHIWRGELVNQRKDGSRYDEAMAIAPVLGASGAIQNFVAIKQDITERKTAELQLQRSEQRLELALAGSGLGLWDWDVPSGAWDVSARWAAILGYQPQELAPHVSSPHALLHPQDAAAVHAAQAAHLGGETPAYVSEHRLRHKDGHWVWVLDRGRVMVRAQDGSPLRAAGTLLDITEHKRLNLEGAALLRRIEALIRDAAHPALPASAAEPVSGSPSPPRLSPRQRQVLALVAQGHTSAQIAQHMRISHATVLTHRRDLMSKLGLHSAAELTRYALTHQW